MINAGLVIAGAIIGGFFIGRLFNDRFMLARPDRTEYIHYKWGRVMVITCHPYDGACLIIERRETTDPDDDELVLDTCERSDLTPLPDDAVRSQWPYLGFTSP